MISPRLKQAFLLLLRQGLWGRKEDASALFPLAGDEWMEVYAMARKQTVQGIVCDGLELLDASHYPPKGLWMRWAVELDTIERINRQHRAVREVLRHLLSQPPALPLKLLKGIGIADFYRRPLHRIAGDIDLWLGNERQAELANQRMEQQHIYVNRGENGESGCVVNGVLVELHSVLITLHGPSLRKELRRWEEAVFAQEGEIPTPVANHLLQSTHILKHLINEGIGLRQLCDAAVSLVALSGQTDTEELKRISRQWHIYRWNKLLYALLVKYIGMPQEYLPFPTRTNPDRLMDEIWESGNFGHEDDRQGARPAGKWAGKWFTLRRIAAKSRLSLGYAAYETCSWFGGLAATRLKELFGKKK